MEYLIYIIIGLYVWEVYLETHWYKLKDYSVYKNLQARDTIKDNFNKLKKVVKL